MTSGSPVITMKRLFLLGLALLAVACSGTGRQPAPRPAATGSFSLFLQPLPQESHGLTFEIGELVALRADGGEVPLTLPQSRLLADDLIGMQKELARATLPPGRYRGIALRIVAAELLGEDGAIALLTPQDRLVAEYSFLIRENQAETLFLSLGTERIVTDGALFTPRFSLWQPERTLVNLKGFVSNRDSRSLTVFNKRTAQVIGSIRVGAEPGDLALDQRRGWLYVALTGENAIAVIEVNSDAILGRAQLRFGDRPTELALTASGEHLVVLNAGSSSVSLIDTRALFETARIKLAAEPSELFIGANDTLAYVTHADTNSLSVIDLSRQTLLRTVALDEAPLTGVAGRDGHSLYLINDYSAELSVLDAASLARQGEILVGNGAVSLLSDGTAGLLYVGMRHGEIAVVDPRAAIAIDTFTLPPEPVQALAIDNEENALFAVLPKSRILLKVDLVSKRELGRLELAGDGHAVAVMGER